MRTTLNLDEDVERAARAIAKAEGSSLGAVISELCRRGLSPREAALDFEDDLPVFRVPKDARPLTSEMVQAALDE